MFAANTQWLLGHMEECTDSGSDLDHPGQKPKFALEMDNATDLEGRKSIKLNPC